MQSANPERRKANPSAAAADTRGAPQADSAESGKGETKADAAVMILRSTRTARL
jgi:hypothetical protein